MISEPGVYDGIPDHEYHRNLVEGGSLSSTGIRRLLPPSCPALYRHWADNPAPPKREFDLGHAVHSDVLGTGAQIVAMPHDSYRTKAAQEARDGAYARGHVPLLPAEVDQVKEMAFQVRAHPLAGRLLGGNPSDAERTIVWQDDATGAWCRARPDYLTELHGRPVMVDLKTTAWLPTTDAWEKAIATHGYHLQGAHYTGGAAAVGLGEDIPFLFVVACKVPPYAVRVFQLDADALKVGAEACRQGLEIYRDCAAADRWPWPAGWDDEITLVGLPRWATPTTGEF